MKAHVLSELLMRVRDTRVIRFIRIIRVIRVTAVKVDVLSG